MWPRGCHAHGVTLANTIRWWRAAEEQDAGVGVCLCCGGPSPFPASVREIGNRWIHMAADVCRHCQALTPARWQEITQRGTA